jgi:hypothetical protein
MGAFELGDPARFRYFSQWLALGVGVVFSSGSRAASCALRLAQEVTGLPSVAGSCSVVLASGGANPPAWLN